MKRFVALIGVLGGVMSPAVAHSSDVRVCVDVQIRTHQDEDAEKEAAHQPPEPAPTARRRVFPFPPRAFLKRLIEHYVTHERGFVSVDEECQHKLVVELYPLRLGWTAFGRYTGYQTEEKVDLVTYGELARLAERLVTALLYDRRVEDTVHRLNVLRADSVQDIETIRGESHFVSAVGSTVKVPLGNGIPTAENATDPARARVRLLNHVNLQLGYRGSYPTWGLDAFMRVGIGTGHKAAVNNKGGGHVDHDVDIDLGMSFLSYLNPRAVNAFYAGAGGLFEMTVLSAIKPQEPAEGQRDNDELFGAGLTVVGILGYEFLRTSRVRPYAQVEINLPAWYFTSENDFASVKAWIPGASLMLGTLF